MVLLLQHVHVEVIQEVVPVIIHPALVQLRRSGQKRRLISKYSAAKFDSEMQHGPSTVFVRWHENRTRFEEHTVSGSRSDHIGL